MGAPIPRIMAIRNVSIPPKLETRASATATTNMPYHAAHRPDAIRASPLSRMACRVPVAATKHPLATSMTCGSTESSPTSANRRPSKNSPTIPGNTAVGPFCTETAQPISSTVRHKSGTQNGLSAGIQAGSTANGRHTLRHPPAARSTNAVPVSNPKTRGERARKPTPTNTQASAAAPLPATPPANASKTSMGKAGPSSPKTGNQLSSPSSLHAAPTMASTPESAHRPPIISARQTAAPRRSLSGSTAKTPSAANIASKLQRTKEVKMEPGPNLL